MEAAATRPHFGALLRQFRLGAGLTQQELAERAGLSVEAIGALERGARTRPHRDTVRLLARALALSPGDGALLAKAVGIPNPLRYHERSEALNASLLRLVRPNAQPGPKHNLPQQLTSFVGRQRDIREIAGLLRDCALVTITGAGGVGKTRVALHLGNEILDDWPDGVWLVDLAPLADQSHVAGAILSTLQLPSTASRPLDVVVAHLRTRRLLLILDNCEHVVGAARDVASRIAASCKNAGILSTSREALGIRGERVYRLPSLACPRDSCADLQELREYGAVELFVHRAVSASAGFALTDDNKSAVVEICRRLDGIPLAVELAAARVKVLTPRQIADRLDRRFRLLAGADTQALPRHQTMVALMDWSYDLLTPREQRFFESLSVFAGGCTLEAATAVGADDGEDDLNVIAIIESLVAKSLLAAEPAGDAQRYWLLESTRQYAREKLTARGEHEQVARRHAAFYAQLAERLERAWKTTPDRKWLPLAIAELDNWRTTLDWTIAKGRDVVLGQRLAASPRVVWHSFPAVEARRWVSAALELADTATPTLLSAGLNYSVAVGAVYFAEHKFALEAAERALAGYSEHGELAGVAHAQESIGKSLAVLGRTDDAKPLLQQALSTARALNDRRLTARVLATTGMFCDISGDLAGGRVCLIEALETARKTGAELLAALIVGSLGSNEYDSGNPEAAIQLTLDGLAIYRSLNSPAAAHYVPQSVVSLAVYLIAAGRYEEARQYANEALELTRSLGLDVFSAFALLCLAIAAALNLDVRERGGVAACAARVLAFADAQIDARGIPRLWRLPQEYPRALDVLRDAVGADDLARLMEAGATMTEGDAVEQAQELERYR
jgi:predicted ATPase/transcriptional regulator with XRE-family HTH domain